MLAASARKVIATNGLADRIKVFDCHSGKLDRQRDLGGGVDMVVSEIFAEGVIGEGVIDSLAHARAELAAPGALFVPEQADIMVALAQLPVADADGGTGEGFDLAQWLRLTFAPVTPRETAPGERFNAGLTYAADTLALWCAPES